MCDGSTPILTSRIIELLTSLSERSQIGWLRTSFSENKWNGSRCSSVIGFCSLSAGKKSVCWPGIVSYDFSLSLFVQNNRRKVWWRMCLAICTPQEVVGDPRILEEGGFLAGWELASRLLWRRRATSVCVCVCVCVCVWACMSLHELDWWVLLGSGG